MPTVTVPLDDLRHGRPVRVEGGSTGVLVALVDDHVVAYEDACRHRGTSLVTGHLRRCQLTCPAHLWRYDLRTGERVDASGEPLPRYRVDVVDGVARVTLPEPPPRMSMRETLLAAARTDPPAPR